jgi:hypothetical protein
MNPNPFAQLIQHATRSGKRRKAARLLGHTQKPDTKTERLRTYLRQNGRATAADLAIEADLDNTGLVWALLKGDIAKGAVEMQGGHYTWNDEYDDQEQQELKAAMRRLRAAGFVVVRRTQT